MGKSWDYGVPGVAFWQEILRVAKPGAHLLAFGGSRTYHRLAVAIEDAGWEIRDTIMWVYGSGFPKSMNVSKAIDKAERGVPQGGADPTSKNHGKYKGGCSEDNPSGRGFGAGPGQFMKEAGTCGDRDLVPEAKRWDGWGTALKPAHEPIVVARKPFKGTVAKNVLEHGTGAMNIDGCRIEGTPHHNYGRTCAGGIYTGKTSEPINTPNTGRWPANFIHDGSDEVVGMFPESKGQQGDVKGSEPSRTGGDGTNCYSEYGRIPADKRGDSGSAARFFYCAKASKKDRNEGLEDLPVQEADPYGQHRGRRMEANNERFDGKPASKGQNTHPTVKPTDLMRYLCRLVTPPGGIVLDPFMGSGSTGKAAMLEGFRFVGIEIDEESAETAKKRIEAASLSTSAAKTA